MDRKNNGSIAFIARQLPSFRKELRQLRASQEEIKRQNALILELIRHTATSANVRKAVRDILNGDASRARPQRNAAKRRQVAAAEAYLASHCGCTLHNACVRSFRTARGGYASAKTMYRVMLRMSL